MKGKFLLVFNYQFEQIPEKQVLIVEDISNEVTAWHDGVIVQIVDLINSCILVNHTISPEGQVFAWEPIKTYDHTKPEQSE